MNKKNLVKISFGVAAIIIFIIVVLYLPYIVANYQYEKLIAESNLTKEDVETNLFLYSGNKINISDSLWGKDYQLSSGDSCWQYMILWSEPIDIVYDDNNKVKKIFASFE